MEIAASADSLGTCDLVYVGKDGAGVVRFEEKTYDCCVSASYDPTKQFCQDGNLYALCDGKSYGVMTEYCDGGTVFTKGRAS